MESKAKFLVVSLQLCSFVRSKMHDLNKKKKHTAQTGKLLKDEHRKIPKTAFLLFPVCCNLSNFVESR